MDQKGKREKYNRQTVNEELAALKVKMKKVWKKLPD